MSYLPPNTGENFELVERDGAWFWKKKNMSANEKIYIVIPKWTYCELPGWGFLPVSCGHAMAQASHVTAVLQNYLHPKRVQGITTIVLAVKTSSMLKHFMSRLEDAHIMHFPYYDEIGPGRMYLTAVATVPITREQAQIFSFLPSWDCKDPKAVINE